MSVICIAVERAASAVRWLKDHSAAFFFMYLLYLDDSGSISNKDENYIVLGGISVSEHQCYHFTSELDRIARSIDSNKFNDIEFHASEIFSRRSSPWDRFSKEEAQGVIKAVLKVVSDSYDSASIFACAIHKESYSGQNTLNMAFEDLAKDLIIFSNLNMLPGKGKRDF